MKAKNGAGPGSGPAYSPQKQRPLSCATGARPRPQKMLMIHQYICNPRIVGTCLRHVDVFAWISMAPCQRHGPTRGGMPFKLRLGKRDRSPVALLWVARGDLPCRWVGAAPGSGAVCRRCVIGWSRPGTCRVPMGRAGLPCQRHGPTRGGMPFKLRLGNRDPGRVAFLWVAGGEKEREVATKATSLQSRISS